MFLVPYIIRRLGLGVFVLVGVTVITFTLSRVIPGNPAVQMLGPHATEEKILHLRRKWGLDQPLPIQYFRYLKGLLQGDLGVSIYTKHPVMKDLKEYVPATLELSIASLIFSLLIGIPLGVISAVKRNSIVDHIARIIALNGVSMPVFWLGLLLLLFFYLQLGWFPAGGRLSITVSAPKHFTGLYVIDSALAKDWQTLLNSIWHLILPAFTLGFCIISQSARMTRSSTLEVLRKDYVDTARAKGISELRVIYKHVFRNAMLPVLTIAGTLFGRLVAGAILTETIFSWPGVGLYIARTILYLDYQPVMSLTVVVALCYIIINLLVDLSYAFIDPRITFKE